MKLRALTGTDAPFPSNCIVHTFLLPLSLYHFPFRFPPGDELAYFSLHYKLIALLTCIHTLVHISYHEHTHISISKKSNFSGLGQLRHESWARRPSSAFVTD